jgi:hypothetical protein
VPVILDFALMLLDSVLCVQCGRPVRTHTCRYTSFPHFLNEFVLKMPIVHSVCKLAPALADVGAAFSGAGTVSVFERSAAENLKYHSIDAAAIGAAPGAIVNARSTGTTLSYGVPVGAAVSIAVAAALNKKDGLPKAREFVVSFGGERLPDGSGRCAPTSDLLLIDTDSGLQTVRTAPAEGWWPDSRKFAACAVVYRAGGFSVFDEDSAADSKPKAKAKVQSTSVPAPAAGAVSMMPATRKGSAGAMRDANSVIREQAVEDLLAAAATGACAVFFGGVDAAGRFSDELLLLNVEAALQDAVQPAVKPPPAVAPSPGLAATGSSSAGITSSVSSLPAGGGGRGRRWWVLPPKPEGPAPSARMHHSLTTLPPGNAIALFGGYGVSDAGGESAPLSDVWLLDVQVSELL